MYNGVKYEEKILESGLVVPVEVQTEVFLRVTSTPEFPSIVGVREETIRWVEITPKNKSYPTLVLEFEDGDTLNNSFAKHVLSDQGIDVDVIKAATVHIR